MQMLSRRGLLAGIVFGSALLAGTTAQAIEEWPFDQQSFESAQAAGQSIVVAVHAPWCPICKKQKPILARLGKEPRFKNMMLFELDFDTQKSDLRHFNAQRQSALIVFKGRKEVGRSVGDTNPTTIAALLAKSL
jgi:thioredoxin